MPEILHLKVKNLGLIRHKGTVQWYGEGGMKWSDLLFKLKWLLKSNSPAEYLVIHCSGNDLGYKNLHVLRYRIRLTVLAIHRMLPNTKLIWSQVLPRQQWRKSNNVKAMNRAAQRINSFAASLIGSLWGFYIKYPEIKWYEEGLFSDDKVHLSFLGNCIFVHHIQAALQYLFGLNSNG